MAKQTAGDWYVIDPQPDADPPFDLYGPFPTEQAAFEYANVLYPEDGIGEAVVLPAVKP